MTGSIRNVSDTALWVAMYRARESERPDALFQDRFARRLAGERGEAILRAMPRGRAMSWPLVVRTAVMDEIILRLVGRGCRTVLNLAAGLDARAFRLALPRTLRWVDVDLPELIAYRTECLAGETPACDYEAVAVDLKDATARATVFARAAASGPVLVVAEGLLVYLADADVASLASQLHAQPALVWWLLDIASPALLKMLKKTWGKNLAQGNAPLRFAPPESTAFFTRHGWREVEFRSTWQEAMRLRRTMPLAWFWNLVAKVTRMGRREEFRRFAGIALLERT